MAVSNKVEEGGDMEAMKIKFGGDTHLIEANTFINSLVHFTTIVQEVNKELDPEKKVEVKIKANKEGSFVVDIVIETSNLIDAVKGFFSADNVGYAANLVGAVGGVYTLAKFLSGTKPKDTISTDDNKIKIENTKGEVNYFDFKNANIYLGNRVIREAISNEFATLENDESVTDFEILDKNDNSIVEVPRQEFSNIAANDSQVLDKNERISKVEATLNIVALDLEFRKKWDFYYNGNKISAWVRDDKFKERINKGERFGKGDSLKVEIDIKQDFDESVNTYVNKAYTVTNILHHYQKPTQGNLHE